MDDSTDSDEVRSVNSVVIPVLPAKRPPERPSRLHTRFSSREDRGRSSAHRTPGRQEYLDEDSGERSPSIRRGRSQSRTSCNYRERNSGSIPDRARLNRDHRPSRNRQQRSPSIHRRQSYYCYRGRRLSSIRRDRERRRNQTNEPPRDRSHTDRTSAASRSNRSTYLSSGSSSRSRSPVWSTHKVKNKSQGHDRASANQIGINDLVSALQAVKSSDSHQFPHSTIQNVIPEFDPSHSEQTIDMWLHKVNECAIIYKWDDRQTTHFALPKLKGRAQKWYEGLQTVLLSWVEWQEKLRVAFPSKENYGQLLWTMLAKRAKFGSGESLEDYYHDKVVLLNRCGIAGKNAIDCILFGVEDRNVRFSAEAAQFESPEKLLVYLRNCKASRKDRDNHTNDRSFKPKDKSPDVKDSESDDKAAKPKPKCFNCNEIGHYKSDCPKPILKCTKCSSFGHVAETCTEKPKDSEVKAR